MPPLKFQGQGGKSKKKSAPSKKSSKSAPPPTSFKSAEYVQESDKEEPENSENESESDSDDESLPSNPVDIMITPNGKLQRPTGSSSSSENESESDENGSEADDEEEEEPSVAARQTAADPDKMASKPSRGSVVTFQKPPPYKPPVGFERASLEGTPKAEHMFKRSSLEGKQIWYFTAPASLPVSAIAQMSWKDATDGKPIINHNGNEYGFMRDSAEDKTYTKIMVPDGSDDGYRTAKNPIDQIFHLQQIVQLPGAHASSSITASSSKETVPAKKPIRQQPQGLKMRFRPIGFGGGETGKIGSSSSSVDSGSDDEVEQPPAAFRQPVPIASESSEEEESSEDSGSDEESSSSDVKMTEAPPLLIKPIAEERKNKTSATVPSSQEVTNGSLKRKHGEKEERKSKHSSSRSSSIDDRELKRLKKKQTESQRGLGDRASVSIEPRKSSTQGSSAKSGITSSKADTPIRPPKSAILPRSPPAPRAQPSPGKGDQRPSEKLKSKKGDRSEPVTPLTKSKVSLQDLTKATDPSLTGEERRKKIKRLKNKE
ncbi:DNA-directed RNA polymerase I subunit RPA34.5-domain-containing protein [Hyaloscypha finlandica]|nr:DNA-directed RNA polymerase I subunit RPA34.5-domain-containing protein [Hyaloscypha finlandica]